MAVYTEVGDTELEAFLAEYDIGEADSFKGVAEGVENSNYLLTTTRGQYFLTLYEKRVDPRDLPFFLGLMDHLAARGLNCPRPIHGRDGQALRTLAGKPAAITTFLHGLWPRRILLSHCGPVGEALAALKSAGLVAPNEADELERAWRLQQDLSQVLKIALPEGEDPSHEPEPLRALLAKAGHAADFKALAETLREQKAAARRAFEAVLG